MRWLLAIAALAWVVPVQAQENPGEKLYRGLEKKLADAKAGFKVAFDLEMTDNARQIEVKGDLLVGPGNQMHISFAGSQTEAGMGAAPLIFTAVSNGHLLGMKINEKWHDVIKSEATPRELTTYLKGYAPATGVFFSMASAVEPQPEAAPDKIKLRDFQIAGQEKIRDTQTQVLAFALDLPGGKGPAHCVMWFDVKTNLPIKRVIEFTMAGQATRVVEEYRNWRFDATLVGDEFALPK